MAVAGATWQHTTGNRCLGPRASNSNSNTSITSAAGSLQPCSHVQPYAAIMHTTTCSHAAASMQPNAAACTQPLGANHLDSPALERALQADTMHVLYCHGQAVSKLA